MTQSKTSKNISDQPLIKSITIFWTDGSDTIYYCDAVKYDGGLLFVFKNHQVTHVAVLENIKYIAIDRPV